MSSGVVADGSRYWASRASELTDALVESMTRIRRDYAALLDLVSEMDYEDVAKHTGYGNLPTLLTDLLRVTPSKARRLVAHAMQVTETVTPTGHLSPAPLPATRQALRDGLIDAEHLDVITHVVKQIPTSAPAGTTELVETTLATQASTSHPGLVRSAGEVLLARIDQDGYDPHTEDRLAEPGNTLRRRRTRDGRMILTADLDPEAAEELDILLDTYGKPQPEAPGVPEPRTQPERFGDALAEIIHLAAGAADQPTNGGEKPHLTVTIDYHALIENVGAATLETGAFLPASAARRLACDASIIPIVMGGDSEPLDVGRKHRTVTPGQRKALIARDHGCAFPTCDRPPRWTDAHHITWWQFGGNTDIGNLVLLCRRHHRLIHHTPWQVRVTDGHPEFIPPTWLGPAQHPQRNHIHPQCE